MRHALPALYWQDLVVDDEWESPARTLTEADIGLFAGLSGDYNPLHVDAEAAAAGPFGGRVAHGDRTRLLDAVSPVRRPGRASTIPHRAA